MLGGMNFSYFTTIALNFWPVLYAIVTLWDTLLLTQKQIELARRFLASMGGCFAPKIKREFFLKSKFYFSIVKNALE